MITSFGLRRLLLVAALFGPMSAWSQSDCEKQCLSNYQSTTYPGDQQMCMRSRAPGRCIDETIANARNYCRNACVSAVAPKEREEVRVGTPRSESMPDSDRPADRRGASSAGGVRD